MSPISRKFVVQTWDSWGIWGLQSQRKLHAILELIKEDGLNLCLEITNNAENKSISSKVSRRSPERLTQVSSFPSMTSSHIKSTRKLVLKESYIWNNRRSERGRRLSVRLEKCRGYNKAWTGDKAFWKAQNKAWSINCYIEEISVLFLLNFVHFAKTWNA